MEDDSGSEDSSSDLSVDLFDEEIDSGSEPDDEVMVGAPSRGGRLEEEAGARKGCKSSPSRGHLSLTLPQWKTLEERDERVPAPPRFFPKRPPGVQPPLNTGNLNQERYFVTFLMRSFFSGWSTTLIKRLACEPPSQCHVRDRFRHILSNLQLSDPKSDAENDARKGMEDYDPIHRVRELLDMQNLSVDERMVATKAKLRIKQYMKAKPTKVGLKLFVLADVNGYTVDYILYSGKSTTGGTRKGLTFDVVTQLVRRSSWEQATTSTWTTLHQSISVPPLDLPGLWRVRTYREGRTGVPKQRRTRWTRSHQGEPSAGFEMVTFYSLNGWTPGRSLFAPAFHLVYSGDTVQRWEKKGQEYQRVTVQRPTAVTEYNKYMGGVDTSDQLLATNSFCHTQRGVCQSAPTHMTRQQFQESLTVHLLGVASKEHLPPTPMTTSPCVNTKQRHSLLHLPVPLSAGKLLNERYTKGRRTCRLCKMHTIWKLRTV
ncbi:hypothetical protein WMY93_001985 [Mugilogobius chulae]|uniref:PiggyBac transposable element-derived protein domain-containing protein n=1 Tax=Mugilogobius chulae TaxID=88201 RepID=A0AAW0PVJ3_9GOBI